MGSSTTLQQILQQIHDVGGWTFASLVLAAMVYAFIKGLVVARPVYDEAVQRADKALEGEAAAFSTVDRLAKAIDVLTSAMLRTAAKFHD